jgi:hypothetical protein
MERFAEIKDLHLFVKGFKFLLLVDSGTRWKEKEVKYEIDYNVMVSLIKNKEVKIKENVGI